MEVGPDGHVQLRDRTLYMPVGLYVAVDYFDRVLYIGQVSRNSGTGIVERVQNHHAIPPTSVGVWILPLRDDLSPMTVSRFEETIITAYQPPANCRHCQRGRETARMPKYTVASSSAPVCPAGPGRSRDFVASTFGELAGDVLDGAPAALSAPGNAGFGHFVARYGCGKPSVTAGPRSPASCSACPSARSPRWR